MIDSDVSLLMDELEEFTTDLTRVTTVTLNQLAQEVPSQIISGLDNKTLDGPNSKGLRGSIKASVNGTRIEIGMNYYGYFQIFGVSGNAIPLGGVAGQFDKQPTDIFAFKTPQQGSIPSSPKAANTILNLSDIISELITESI